MNDLILGSAGAIGIATALVHGYLTQKLMVRPIDQLIARSDRISGPIRRLVPLLLQYSTFSWVVGGGALIAIACGWQPGARLMVSMVVGVLYLYGAFANGWGTRGRHPGWMLMAGAVALIILDLGPSSGV